MRKSFCNVTAGSASPYSPPLLFALLPVTGGKLLITAPRDGCGPSSACHNAYTWITNRRTNLNGTAQISAPLNTRARKHWGLMRVLACLIAAAVYVWREQIEFSFSQLQFAVFILVLSILSLRLVFSCVVRHASNRQN